MSYTLPPISITVNQMSPIDLPGDLGAVAYVKITNLSPYLILLANIAGGRDWLQPGECNVWNVTGIGTTIQATPQQIANSSTVPAALLVVTWYLEGEQPQGTYPVNFNILSYIGNNLVASQIVNDGNPMGSSVLESTPSGSNTSYLLMRNDGTVDVQAISNNVLTDILHITPGGASTPASLAVRLLNALGVSQFDGGHIKTDGNGNLTVGTTTANSTVNAGSLQLYGQNGGAGGLGVLGLSIAPSGTGATAGAQYQLGGPNGPGAYAAHEFSVINNGSQVFLFQIGTPQTGSPPLAWVDGGGVVHSPAPITLTSGNQETGFCGNQAYITAGAALAFAVNFKTMLSNAPTGVTLTSQAAVNTTGAISAGQFQKAGFWAYISAASSAVTQWNGAYTTIGNCLLAVDAVTGTIAHHCDICGNVSSGVPVSSIAALNAPHAAMSYVCLACGATEAFNCTLTASDELDMTPQGSGQYTTTRGAQAQLIRQLQAALGIPLQ